MKFICEKLKILGRKLRKYEFFLSKILVHRIKTNNMIHLKSRGTTFTVLALKFTIAYLESSPQKSKFMLEFWDDNYKTSYSENFEEITNN